MPAYQLSGITQIQTGLTPVTGTPSGYAGPWLIETQSLSVQYARVPAWGSVTSDPTGTTSGTTVPTSLSAVHARYTAIQSTKLNVIVVASYSRVKSYEYFSTSAYLQNQKFSVLAEADQFGEYYGNAGQLSGVGILGPAGNVITSQPYVRRVAWDDNLHSEVSYTIRGSNHLVGMFNGHTLWDCLNSAQAPTFNSYTHIINNDYGHTYLNDYAPRIFSQFIEYPIMGTYSLARENAGLFASLLTQLGNKIKNTVFYKVDPVLGTDITGNGSSIIYQPSVFVGISEYNPNRHDYT